MWSVVFGFFHLGCFLFFFNFFYFLKIYLREHELGEGQRERESVSPGQGPHCQHRAPCGLEPRTVR